MVSRKSCFQFWSLAPPLCGPDSWSHCYCCCRCCAWKRIWCSSFSSSLGGCALGCCTWQRTWKHWKSICQKFCHQGAVPSHCYLSGPKQNACLLLTPLFLRQFLRSAEFSENSFLKMQEKIQQFLGKSLPSKTGEMSKQKAWPKQLKNSKSKCRLRMVPHHCTSTVTTYLAQAAMESSAFPN